MSHSLTNFDRMSCVRVATSQLRSIRSTSDPQRSLALSGVSRVVIAVLMALAIGGVTLAGEHSNPWLLSWIPAYCCVTNDCCWEVAEQDLNPLPEDKWQVRATGQVRERTNWSPDGKFYRCACDYDSSAGLWIRHIAAHTRCIFVPMRMSSLKTG